VAAESEVDKEEALQWFLRSYPQTERMGFHTPLYVSWAAQWEIRPRVVQTRQPINATPPFQTRLYFLDTRLATSAELREAAAKYHVQAIGELWLIDRNQPRADVTGFRFAEKEPNLIQSFWYGSTEPLRKVEADPWTTWEWRTLLGQPAAPPTVVPVTLNDLRVAHNVAVAAGNKVQAAALRQKLGSRLNVNLKASFDNGTQLIGAYRHRGAQRSLTLLFLAGSFKTAAKFSVTATVVKAPRFSMLPLDPAIVDIATNPPVPTDLWKAGHIYQVKVVYRKRPGTERLTGAFTNTSRTDGAGPIELLLL
jgi:hypothetical protein